jgi:hypothetical protein
MFESQFVSVTKKDDHQGHDYKESLLNIVIKSRLALFFFYVVPLSLGLKEIM